MNWGGYRRELSWLTQRAIPAFFWKDYKQRQTTSIVHFPSRIRLKQLFEYIYRVVKSGELEGYQLTSSGRDSSVDIVSRVGAKRQRVHGSIPIESKLLFRSADHSERTGTQPVPCLSGTMDRFIAGKAAPGIQLTRHIVYC